MYPAKKSLTFPHGLYEYLVRKANAAVNKSFIEITYPIIEFKFLESDRKGSPQTIDYLFGELSKRIGGISKKYNLDLQSSKDQFRKVIENIEFGVMIVDMDLTIRYMNKTAKKILDPDSKSILDNKFSYPLKPGTKTKLQLNHPDGSPMIIESDTREIYLDSEKKYVIYLKSLSEEIEKFLK